MLEKILTLVVAPAIAGSVVQLFAYWLKKRSND